MKSSLVFLLISLSFFSLKSEETDTCITFDYRFLLQRAWDENSNIQLIKKANQYLESLRKKRPECQITYQNEINQNNVKINSVKNTNFNAYPFATYFSTSFRNQKFFTDGDQVAIEDSMKELKVIMEKLVIREGQIPILFIVNFDELDISKEEINRLTELYFSYMFINVEGINYYAPYNRLEHNEILKELPLNKSILEPENISKIINRIALIDKWNKLFIISLTPHNILSSNYYNTQPKSKPNQSFITVDLYKVGLDIENPIGNLPILIASADSTGINLDKYLKSLLLILIIFPIFLLGLYLLRFYISNKNIIYIKKNSNNYLFNNLLFSLVFSLVFLFSSFKIFPNSFLIDWLLADAMATLPKYTWILIHISNVGLLILLFLLLYIISNKFIDSSFLLKNKKGLPILFSISFYGIVSSIVIKLKIYDNIYTDLDINQNDFINEFMLFYIYLYFLLSSYYIGRYIQKNIFLTNILKINKVKLDQKETFDESVLQEERKLLLKRLYMTKLFAILMLIGISQLFEVILKININTKILDLINIPNILCLFPAILIYHLRLYKKNYPASFKKKVQKFIELENISRLDDINKLSNKQLIGSIVYRIDLETQIAESKDNIEQKVNYYLVIGDEKSGKTDLIKEKLRKELKVRLEENVIELDFSKNLNSPEDLSIFIEEGELFIPEIASLHESMKMGKFLEKQMKSPISKLIEEIPMIGKYIHQFIHSDSMVDSHESLIIIKTEIIKAYLNFIKSEVENFKTDKYVIFFKNIHKCNTVSFDIILKLFNLINNEIDKNKIIIIITYNDKFSKEMYDNQNNSSIITKNLLDLNHNKSFKSDFSLINTSYNFNLLFTKGFDLNKLKKLMKEKYNFLNSPMNDNFIETLYHTFSVKGYIYLHYVNYTLEKYVSLNKLFINNSKFIINEFIESIEFHDELKKEFELIIEDLNEDEKDLLYLFVVLHEKTSLIQLSNIMKISEVEIEKMISQISKKNSDIFTFKNFNEIRLNNKFSVSFREKYVNPTSKEDNKNVIKFNFYANNLYDSILKQKEISEFDLLKLLNFLFYLSDPYKFYMIYSLFIRKSIFSSELKNKLPKVNNKISTLLKIKKYSTDLRNNFIYLNSLNKEYYMVKGKSNIERYELNDKNITPIGQLGILCFLYNIKSHIENNMTPQDLSSTIKKLRTALNNLFLIKDYESDIFVSWFYTIMIFYIKYFFISTDSTEIKIYKELIELFKIKFPELSYSIDILLNPDTLNKNKYLEIKNIYLFVLSNLDILIENNEKKINIKSNNCIERLNFETLKLELENHKLRVINYILELSIEKKEEADDIIMCIFESKEKLKKTFESSLAKYEEHQNNKGSSIIYQLYSDYYYNHEKYDLAIQMINKSINKSKNIKDYKGMEYGYETIIKIYETLLSKKYNKEYEKNLNKYKDNLEHIKPLKF